MSHLAKTRRPKKFFLWTYPLHHPAADDEKYKKNSFFAKNEIKKYTKKLKKGGLKKKLHKNIKNACELIFFAALL